MPVASRSLSLSAACLAVALAQAVAPAGDAGPPAATQPAVDIVPEGIAGGLRPGAAPAVLDRIGAAAWHAAGHTGQGVTIGLIDFVDVPLYWNPALGAAPTADDVICIAAGVDCAAEFFDGVDQGGENHGPAVVGVIRTVAPGARIVYGRARTLADYRTLIDRFAERGVTIVNRSLGSRYDGPGDGRGGLDEVVDQAVALGMLWVNSGGNNGNGKYYREPVTVRDGWVDFGGSRYLEFTGAAQLAGVRWAADWDLPAAQRTDYDVYLSRAPAGRPGEGTEVARSALRQHQGAAPLETIAGRYVAGPGERLYLAVRHQGGDTGNDVLEVLDLGDGFTGGLTSMAGSAAVPVVDSRSAGVLSVGAIDPPTSGTVAAYSAQGPTTDGRVAPTLSAPTGYSNVVWGGFSGTSAAAAVVAGAAALVEAAGVASGPAGLAGALRAAAIDRGPAGPDHAFGVGEVRLPALRSDQLPATGMAARFVPLAPTRVLDTRLGGGALAAGETRLLPLAGSPEFPSDADAVAVNVAAVDVPRAGYLQLLPTGQATVGAFSNVNTDGAEQTRANFAIVPLGDGGSISVHASAGGDVVVDVLGYFIAADTAPAAGRLVALDTPVRALDTRRGPSTPMRSGDRRAVPVPDAVDPSLAAALVVTVTATGITQPGWMQAYPTGHDELVGTTSTLNLTPGETVANLAIVPIGAGGMSIAGQLALDGQADVVVDVIGYVTSDAAAPSMSGRFVAVAPERAYDSRTGTEGLGDRGSVDVVAPGVPADASLVVWNTAIVAAARPGYARVWAAASAEPATSALNWSRRGETRAVATVSAASDGTSRFVVDDGAADQPGPLGHLIVDVFGYFTA